MNTEKASRKVLISWIGFTDLDASQGKIDGVGPVAQALEQRDFDLAVLLSNTDKKATSEYIKWLEKKDSPAIELHLASLSSPTDFGDIYKTVTERVSNLLGTYGDNTKLTYHLSPGTPAMAAVWIILAKTRYAAELIESSRQYGVKTANVPFDIYADFIPELFKRRDAEIEKLASGSSELSPAFSQIIHRSSEMKRVIANGVKIAPRTIPVLIEGESGTGKELMARAIHKASTRKDKPFIAVNCGAIPSEIMESEFFGHKKGSFTGASADRKGHFENAHEGTLFLDEIGELPLEMQVRLLRAIQEKTIVRVGTSQEIAIDVRIISATNRNLVQDVSAGRFREDLFYRLAVAVLRLPPLRSRTGDLTLMIDHLMDLINNENVSEPDWKHKKISAGTRKILMEHTWPGNVRELLNTLTRAAIWSAGSTITKEDIKSALFELPQVNDENDAILGRSIENGIDLQEVIAEVASHYISRVIKETGNNKSRAAQLLGFNNYQTLKNWIEKYNVE